MADGSEPPSEISLDEKGLFTVLIDSAITKTYDINVQITSTDGWNDHILTFPLIIHTVCGPESTTILPPVLTLEGETIMGEFQSSNPNCPIKTLSLVRGGDLFTLK